MRPLGQTRPLLAYGLPAAAGLAVGGALAGQGQQPGVAALGGLAGALGARGGLGAARLAGRYAPQVAEVLQSAIVPVGKALNRGIESVPAGGKRAQALGKARDALRGAYVAAGNVPASTIQRTAASLAVPTAAGLAGLGGAAAGMIPGALGVPGFAQGVDPEAYGSSNSEGARYKTPTTQYM